MGSLKQAHDGGAARYVMPVSTQESSYVIYRFQWSARTLR